MDLTQWLSEGDRTAHALHLETGLSLPVIARARKGRARLASALRIHFATGRQVDVASMTEDQIPEGALAHLAAADGGPT